MQSGCVSNFLFTIYFFGVAAKNKRNKLFFIFQNVRKQSGVKTIFDAFTK